MQIPATNVEEYIKALPEDRRVAIETVRKIILKNLPQGYEEVIQYGMISYVVPLSTYPEGYLGNKSTAISYAALASQKNYMSVYLMNVFGDKETSDWFMEAYKKSGKKLNMGKSCVHFKKLDSLALDVVGQAIARTPVKKFLEVYERAQEMKKS